MSQRDRLIVFFNETKVGTLAMTADRKAAFEYDEEWLKNGFAISPFSLPMVMKVFVPQKNYFDGLFGVFADSLPDAWGRLLLDRMLRLHEINADELSVLDRLAIVGNSGMGALSYRPSKEFAKDSISENFDKLAMECQSMLNNEYSDNIDELYRLGGTSGGARPKIMTNIGGRDWIIKFPAHVDGKKIGKMEYDYSITARKCGIEMAKTKLFPSDMCEGYFGTERFDRYVENGIIKRRHMVTVSGILEVSHEMPSLDYNDLMKLTNILTHYDKSQIEQMYRRMCFNIFAHNRDDHSSNFSYVYDEIDGWRLSPAYDLTYSTTYYGEHTTTVDGNGIRPERRDLVSVGTKAGLSRSVCNEIADEIEQIVMDELNIYLS